MKNENFKTTFYISEPIRKTNTAEENIFVSVTFDPILMMNFIKLINSKVVV